MTPIHAFFNAPRPSEAALRQIPQYSNLSLNLTLFPFLGGFNEVFQVRTLLSAIKVTRRAEQLDAMIYTRNMYRVAGMLRTLTEIVLLVCFISIAKLKLISVMFTTLVMSLRIVGFLFSYVLISNNEKSREMVRATGFIGNMRVV